jgi:uncharacterized protein (DUF2141 family)
MKVLTIRILLVFTTLFLCHCARQTTPEGGPKDIIKPELLKSNPQDNQTNFKGKKLELYFSEDIKLKDPKEEIIITPSPGKETKYLAVKNKLTIDPANQWADSTTYSIMFRESIQDITESNPTDELRLAFSTGNTIDSLSIAGFVSEAQTEIIPEKITVALYQADTFDIFKHPSVYFTKTDKEGRFKISNLKPGSYHLYAYDDKNKNLKVESVTEKYGFLVKPIELAKHTDSLEVVLSKIDSRPIKLNSKRSTLKTTMLRFNKTLVEYTIKNNERNIPTTFGDNKTEIVFYHDELNAMKDSTQIRVQATDSLQQKFDSLLYIKQGITKGVKTTFSLSTEPPTLNYNTGQLQLRGKTNILIKEFHIDSLYIQIDSLKKINFKKENLSYQETTKQFVLSAKIDTTLLTKPTEEPNEKTKNRKTKTTISPQLILAKTFAISIYNDSSKRQSIKLPPKPLASTGTLSITVNTTIPNYVIELINNSNESVEKVTNLKKHVFENLTPTDYKIRVTIDENKNGEWDVGNIFILQEHEKTLYYQGNDKKYTIPVRENWEVGPILLTF